MIGRAQFAQVLRASGPQAGVVLALSGMAWMGLALWPQLIDRAPMLLLAMRPRTDVIIAVASSHPVSAVVIIAAPLRACGHTAAALAIRGAGALIRPIEGRGARALAFLGHPVSGRTIGGTSLLVQGLWVDVLVASSRLKVRTIGLLATLSAIRSVTLVALSGSLAQRWLDVAVSFVVEHRAQATVVATLAAVGLSAVAFRRLAHIRAQDLTCNARAGESPDTTGSASEPGGHVRSSDSDPLN